MPVKRGPEMPSEDTTKPGLENVADQSEYECPFDKIMNLPVMRPGRTLPHSKLSNRFFDRMWDKLAKILPVFALGHSDPEVRRLANELYGKLCLNREVNGT